MTAAQAGASTAPASASETFCNVACVFCGLHCDDLDITRSGQKLTVTRNGCGKAKAGFERPLIEAKPRVGGRTVSLEEAIAAAAGLIRNATLPSFGGLGTDVDGMRAIMSIADKARGVVDHALSDGYMQNLRVLQSRGWFATTLTEVRNRADLIIFTSDAGSYHHRFYERVVHARETLFASGPVKRTLVFVGEGYDTAAAQGPGVDEIITLSCKADRIGEVLSALSALQKGTPIAAADIGGVPKAQIEDLLSRCHRASYGVVVWIPSAFKFANADLTIHRICDLVRDLNVTQRFAGLSLGGSEGSTSAAAVCAWQSGYALRVSFASGVPHFDPELYAIPRLIQSGGTDCLLWLSSLTPDLAPPATDVPTIVLGTFDMQLTSEPAVFIPVATPGIDTRGQIMRVDGNVVLPLRDLNRGSGLASPVAVLAAIEAAL
jgi:formylmethanofuran dehydrogenase subunit B